MIDDKPVYMKIEPLIILFQLDTNFEKYQDGKGAVIIKLNKALYECVESAVLWYKDLKAILEADEYRVNPYDYKYTKENKSQLFFMSTTY